MRKDQPMPCRASNAVSALDEPLFQLDGNEPMDRHYRASLCLGEDSPKKAYEKLKRLVGAQAMKRFMKKRYSRGKEGIDLSAHTQSEYLDLIQHLLGNQAGREMVQNAVLEKPDPMQWRDHLIETYWIDQYIEQRSALEADWSVELRPMFSDSSGLVDHPLITYMDRAIGYRESFETPAAIPLIQALSGPLNTILSDYAQVIQTPQRDMGPLLLALFGSVSLYRREGLFPNLVALGCLLPDEIAAGAPRLQSSGGLALGADRLAEIGGSKSVPSIPANFELIADLAYRLTTTALESDVEVERFGALITELQQTVEQASRKERDLSIGVVRDGIALIQGFVDDIDGERGRKLGLDVKTRALQALINRLRARFADEALDTLEDTEIPGFADRFKTHVVDIVIEAQAALDELETQLGEIAERAEKAPWSDRLGIMQAGDEALKRWHSTYKHDLETLADLNETVLESTQRASDPTGTVGKVADDEYRDRAGPPANSASHDPSMWHASDVEQMIEESDQLRANLAAAEARVSALTAALADQPTEVSTERLLLQSAFSDYARQPRTSTLIALITELYADRVRFLDSALRSLEETGDGVTHNAILQKLTALITDGLDGLRAGERYIDINHRVPGELVFSESDTVRNQDRLRKHRVFRDGETDRTMYWHLRLDDTHRVYFDYDADEDRILIGYIGKHLPVGRNPTA
jgi:hypothetical protein